MHILVITPTGKTVKVDVDQVQKDELNKQAFEQTKSQQSPDPKENPKLCTQPDPQVVHVSKSAPRFDRSSL